MINIADIADTVDRYSSNRMLKSTFESNTQEIQLINTVERGMLTNTFENTDVKYSWKGEECDMWSQWRLLIINLTASIYIWEIQLINTTGTNVEKYI